MLNVDKMNPQPLGMGERSKTSKIFARFSPVRFISEDHSQIRSNSSSSSIDMPETIDEKFRDFEYSNVARKMQKSMKLKNRELDNQIYTDTFLAQDLNAWLMEKKLCENRQEANYVGKQMMELGHIYRVSDANSTEFLCTLEPYKFR
eukprot:CAMPEP_0184695312 /NCGR_PEP_ID=MMETSP0313-20130426/2989_1 /TAXON_ID=2792 /ORGANISM="Porphyridium aerugineum, Strain SAG 1380-2" /LENGTH=146 /DNA_ID=CAMNT_0027153747 /DNA_START=666 /DNA_END=1106 /DNA_ORIENTATION=+